MALVNSSMISLGTQAPEFRLPDGEGKVFDLGDIKGSNGLLVAFICNHCPFVKHIVGKLEALHQELLARGIGMVAINSNDVLTHPQDSPDHMLEFASGSGFTFPYLYDESQDIARSYDARCTPDFFLFDAELKLFYRGQLDASRPGNDVPVSGEDLLAAATALAEHRPFAGVQLPSIGCNIKWRD